MKEETIEIINRKFSLYFGEEGTFYTAPGRINLIGEHTDYNGGFVFPGAVDKGIVAKIRPNWDRSVRVYSVDMDSYLEFGIDPGINPYEPWGYYIFGVYMEAIKRYGKDIPGIDAVFAGDVPLGAGMSSSAALESTFAYAINDIFQLGFDKLELARIGQAAEHNYCGVNCGIMDQFASIFGKAGSLIRLDCRSMEYKYFPFLRDCSGRCKGRRTSFGRVPARCGYGHAC